MTKTHTFLVVAAGRDEYPRGGEEASSRSVNNGLRLVAAAGASITGPRASARRLQRDKDFLLDMGLEVLPGDEVEITVRIVSRVVTERVPISRGGQ